MNLFQELYTYENLMKKQSMELAELKAKKKIKTEKKLNHRIIPNNKFSNCYESSDLPMLFLSMQGQLLSWNSAFERTFGIKVDHLYVKEEDLTFLFSETELEKFCTLVKKNVEEKKFSFKVGLTAKTQRVIVLNVDVLYEENTPEVPVGCFCLLFQ
eukprot:gene10601-3119_t